MIHMLGVILILGGILKMFAPSARFPSRVPYLRVLSANWRTSCDLADCDASHISGLLRSGYTELNHAYHVAITHTKVHGPLVLRPMSELGGICSYSCKLTFIRGICSQFRVVLG